MAVNKRKVLDAARKYVQKGAKQKALKEYERLLELDPKDGKLRLEIGDAHRRWGQIDEAVTQYQKVADQYKSEGFDARAVAVFKQVLNLDSKRYSAYVSLAELYQRMGLDSEAIAALQTAADGYHREGKKREALELLRKMATLDPSNTTSRLKVADLLKQEGMEGEAVAEFEAVAEELQRNGSLDQTVGVYARILEIQPRRVDILTATARALVQLRQPERAEPFAKKAIEAEGENVDHYELLCDIYKALERSDELAETTRALARIYRERGDEERAREIMQRLPASEGLDMSGDSEEFVADSDEPELADDDLLDDDFLAADDDGPAPAGESEPGDAFGEPFDASDKVAAAPEVEVEAPAEEVVAEGDPAQLLAEASVYLRYGKRDQAIASLKGVIAQEPDNRDALEKLGDALSESGDGASAVPHWSRAAELAREANETSAIDVLRDRIAAIDPEAAAAIAPGAPADPEAAPDDLPEIELDLDAPFEDGSEADGQADDDDEAFELELDLDEATDEPSPATAEADAPDPVLGDDGDFEIDLDVDDGMAAPPAAEDPAPAAVDANETGSSSDRVAEELEEAEFYFNQGMMDEAETLYQRVLDIAPNHPTARLRMGEIESSRAGEAAESPAAETRTDVDEAASVDVGDGLDDGIEIEIDADDDESDDTTQSNLAPDIAFDDETGVELDGLGDASTPEVAAEPPSEDEGFEIDLDADDDTDLEAAAAEAAAALEDDSGVAEAADEDTAESALSTPTLEQALDEPEEPAAPLAAESELQLEPAAEPEPQPEPEPEPEAEPEPVAEPEPEPAVRSRADDTQPLADGPSDSEDEATFDLAAELREAFEEADEADANEESGVLSTVEDGFASIFSEFKKGVSATLTATDTETRYDLGIAYREMGLFEDAIGEFRVCLTSPDRIAGALTMMGLCALDLGRPADAVSHFEQALAGNELDDAARAGLSFDLGRALEQTGDAARAKAAYETVAEIDADFPEIQERIQALSYADSSPKLQTDLPPAPDPDAGFESFEDLTAEAEADVAEEPAESFESFDDVLTEAEAVIEDAESLEAVEPESEPEPEAVAEVEAVEQAPEVDEAPAPSRPGKGRKKKISFV